jgi:beta-galactosidase beta subunit
MGYGCGKQQESTFHLQDFAESSDLLFCQPVSEVQHTLDVKMTIYFPHNTHQPNEQKPS